MSVLVVCLCLCWQLNYSSTGRLWTTSVRKCCKCLPPAGWSCKSYRALSARRMKSSRLPCPIPNPVSRWSAAADGKTHQRVWGCTAKGNYLEISQKFESHWQIFFKKAKTFCWWVEESGLTKKTQKIESQTIFLILSLRFSFCRVDL